MTVRRRIANDGPKATGGVRTPGSRRLRRIDRRRVVFGAVRWLPLLAVLALACNRVEQTLRLEAPDPLLRIEAWLDFPPQSLPDGRLRLHGRLKVVNRSGRPAPYGNAFLWLDDGKGGRSRAYYDAPASVIYDRSTDDVAPGDSLGLPVYWLLDKRTPGSAWRLAFDRKGLEASS